MDVLDVVDGIGWCDVVGCVVLLVECDDGGEWFCFVVDCEIVF